MKKEIQKVRIYALVDTTGQLVFAPNGSVVSFNTWEEALAARLAGQKAVPVDLHF